MPFQPINEDHAIQSASFAIGLSKPLPWSAIEALVKSALDWRRELPAIDLTQMLDVQINPQTGAPVNRITRGVEFSHKRPDGSASWQLTVLGSEIKVTTTIYTRWTPTWAKAGDILLGVAGQLAEAVQDKDIQVLSTSLQVSDMFFPDAEEPDYSELFARSRHVPAALLGSGKLWHCHTGWFAQRPVGPILNQLNIDVRSGVGESAIVGIPDDRIRVIVQHNQILRPSTPIPFIPDTMAIETFLLTEFPLLHENNKLITRELLTVEMQNRIKVNR